jgi:hypothetical protein
MQCELTLLQFVNDHAGGLGFIFVICFLALCGARWV